MTAGQELGFVRLINILFSLSIINDDIYTEMYYDYEGPKGYETPNRT